MIKDFRDLEVYQLANKLTVEVYKFVETLPNKERYCLIDQLIRASSSIGANIAEGFGRYHTKEYLRFLYIARGSLMEVLHFLVLSSELDYLDQKLFNKFEQEINVMGVKLNNLIAALAKRQAPKSPQKLQQVTAT